LDTFEDDPQILDYIGIGFGPSNLALAVAFDEIAPQRTGLFLERSPQLDWHGGLLFDHSRLQIAFLKDLATLRNPQSRFSFLAYLQAVGRLESFANLREFHPTRLEYLAYLRWAAEAFADQVRYGTTVVSVAPEGVDRIDGFIVETEDSAGVRRRHHARNLVAATGGAPRIPVGSQPASGRVIHASRFLRETPRLFPDGAQPLHWLVAGDGQSAGEVALELMRRYPNATIEVLARSYSLHASDSTPFLNQSFSSTEAARFHAAPRARRDAMLNDLRVTNYGVVDGALLEELYRAAYAASIAGRTPLTICGFSRLDSVTDNAADGRLVARVADRISDEVREVACDGVILATGYDRRLDAKVFESLLPLIRHEADGALTTSPAGAVALTRPGPARLYVQGLAQEAHGIGDSLLSLLAFRSAAIARDIDEAAAPRRRIVAYPPPHHVERDEALLLEVIRRRPFATLAMTGGGGEPMVTQLPLVLRPDGGGRPRLFGHLDRRNPQAALLDGRAAVAVFHGPDSYISPNIYSTDQLPTWNSLSVHVRGAARVLGDRGAVVSGLQSISAQGELGESPYRLDAHDPRIDQLINGIVAFEIEIEEMTGRFKLSQDRNAEDCGRAADVLCRQDDSLRDVVAISLREACPGFAGDDSAGRQIAKEGIHGE
jgi:lysine/ornithine N-monooxygenase